MCGESRPSESERHICSGERELFDGFSRMQLTGAILVTNGVNAVLKHNFCWKMESF